MLGTAYSDSTSVVPIMAHVMTVPPIGGARIAVVAPISIVSGSIIGPVIRIAVPIVVRTRERGADECAGGKANAESAPAPAAATPTAVPAPSSVGRSGERWDAGGDQGR